MKSKGTSEQNKVYCSKDGAFEEHGECPQDPKNQGVCEKRRWDEARAAATEGRFDDIPSDIYMRCHGVCKRIREEALMESCNKEDTLEKHLWFVGKTKCGKSRTARELPNMFLKMCNKWWVNYKGQDNVLIEDFDKKHDGLIHFMKIWADRYPFPCETKGGGMDIRPRLIVVTSNWRPDEIWPDGEHDLEPILSRFTVVHFNGYDDCYTMEDGVKVPWKKNWTVAA